MDDGLLKDEGRWTEVESVSCQGGEGDEPSDGRRDDGR